MGADVRKATIIAWGALGLTACSKSATAGGQAHSLTVSVRDNVFSPSVDSISAGDTVTFIWQGSQLHDLVFQDGIGSVTSQSTGSTKRGFPLSGIYPYRCTIHSTDFTTSGTMVGTIAVY